MKMELVNIGKEEINGELQNVVSSRQIADKFGKEHSKVLRTIENLELPEEFTKANFGLSEYIDNSGKKNKMFLISRDGFSFLVMGFTGKIAAAWKVKFIEAFNKMEKALLEKKPENAIEWAQAFIESETRRQELELKVEEDKEKVEFHDAVTNTEDCKTFDEVAKTLGTGRNKLFKKLRDNDAKVLMKGNIPYQKYIDQGYFRVIQQAFQKGDKDAVSPKTLITGKGFTWIKKKFYGHLGVE